MYATGIVWYFCIAPEDTDFSYAKLYVDGVLLYNKALTNTHASSTIAIDKRAMIKITTVDKNRNESNGVERLFKLGIVYM